MTTAATGRQVLVVGRRPRAAHLPTKALGAGGDILVVAVGWPLTEEQRRLVDAAQTFAIDSEITLCGELVASAVDATRLLSDGDEVHVLGSRALRRRLTRARARVRAGVTGAGEP